MKSAPAAFVLIPLLVSQAALAQQPTTSGQPRLLLASVDSRWPGVYCDLTELSRTAASELTVRYRYRNTLPRAFELQHVDLVPRTRAFDTVGRVLYSVLKDTSGKAISSTNMDGITAKPLPAGGSQTHWARLEAPPSTATALTILVDGCLPFDDVPIAGAPGASPRSTPLAALATQEGESEGLEVDLLTLTRGAGGVVTATFRYRNSGTARVQFPHAPLVRSTYYLDTKSRKKYAVALDKQQSPLCSETLNFSFPDGVALAPGESLALWAKFPAPPDSTTAVNVHIPLAPPFDNVPLSGSGTGSADDGAAVAGAVVGLDAALKDLNANVTPAEIRIHLAADVLFDFDRADIKKDAESSLQKVATVLIAHKGARTTIEGHTDGRGADTYNQTLSEQRAASVKSWLIANAKVDGAEIATRGWGRTKPIAHNSKPDGSDDPEGRAKNRRVEIVVRK